MSYLDELYHEKQITKGAEIMILPESINSTEIADETVPVGDIADDAVTADKIAASAIGNGLSGGGGSAITPNYDASCATAATKLAVNGEGVLPAHLNVDTKGDGFVAAGGAALIVNYDDSTIGVNGSSELIIKAGGATKAKFASDAKRHSISVNLPEFTANSTVRVGALVVPTGATFTITAVHLAAYTKPNDADGTCMVSLVNYDVSGAADEDVVAAWDAEGLTNKTSEEMTVITAGDVNDLEETDMLYIVMVNNSVALDANWAGAVMTIEYEET